MRVFHRICFALVLFASSIPLSRATTVIEYTANTVEALAVDGITINGITYDVTFGSDGANATSPPASALTFQRDATDGLSATQQIIAALNSIGNAQTVRYEDFSTSQSQSNNQFSVIVTSCIPNCTQANLPYLGYAGSLTGNSGPPWTWASQGNVVLTNSEVYALFTPVVSAIPELSTWTMMILGFLGIGALAHRRRLPRTEPG